MGDDNNRQGNREGVHQVEAVLSFDGVQEVVGNLFDSGLKSRDGFGGECPGDQGAQPGMVGGIEGEHAERADAGGGIGGQSRVGKTHVIPQDSIYVLVAAYGPRINQPHAVDWVFAAQFFVQVVRIGENFVGTGVVGNARFEMFPGEQCPCAERLENISDCPSYGSHPLAPSHKSPI